MKFALPAILAASLSTSSAAAAQSPAKGQRRLDEMHAAAFGAVITDHSASDWKKFLSEGPVQVDSKAGHAEEKKHLKSNGRELWWRSPVDTAEYGGSMEVRNKNTEECFNIGEGIGKDGWAFGITKGLLPDTQGSFDTFLQLFMEDAPVMPVYKAFQGAKNVCIGEKEGNVPYLYIEFSDGCYWLIGSPMAGRDDHFPKLKIRDQNGVIVRFRDGPGEMNALWQIYENGMSRTSPYAKWYFIPNNEAVPAVIATGYDDSFRILDCSATTVVAEGEVADNLEVGHLIVSTGTDGDVCVDCSPLYRKVVSISDGPSAGAKLFTTEFATFSDIFAENQFADELSDQAVELPFGCLHSANARLLEAWTPGARELQVASCSDWQTKDSNGNCIWTNCHVGKDGDPVDCFSCKGQCDNGCGAKGSIFNFDGDLYLFDFGPACCIHDFCYSAYDAFSQSDCDNAFYRNMRDACPAQQGNVILSVLLPGSQVGCEVLAAGFYSAVALLGDDARDVAIAEQTAHEKSDECVEKCPSTRESGGRGTYRFTIDMILTEGTFPVYYQMYQIPDALTISHEGNVLFDTGGLVSGSSSFSLFFSGSSSKVDVLITAPNQGTAWDFFIGCPEELGGNRFSIESPPIPYNPEAELPFIGGN